MVVDCLTLWVSNVLLKAIGPERDADMMPPTEWTAIEASVVNEAQALLTDARDRDLTLILVSNEVGMGVVPATSVGRHYRDILGRVNQAMGSRADSVILMIAGLPVDLRQLTAQSIREEPLPKQHRSGVRRWESAAEVGGSFRSQPSARG